MNSGLFGVGILSLIAGFILLLLGAKGEGSIEHGNTKIEGPVSFALIALGIILMAVSYGFA